jgi:hypothetical protein
MMLQFLIISDTGSQMARVKRVPPKKFSYKNNPRYFLSGWIFHMGAICEIKLKVPFQLTDDCAVS